MLLFLSFEQFGYQSCQDFLSLGVDYRGYADILMICFPNDHFLIIQNRKSIRKVHEI